MKTEMLMVLPQVIQIYLQVSLALSKTTENTTSLIFWINFTALKSNIPFLVGTLSCFCGQLALNFQLISQFLGISQDTYKSFISMVNSFKAFS